MDQQDLERIARTALRELGVSSAGITIAPGTKAGHWRIDIQGSHGSGQLQITCGQGSTAQWVRQQIFDQYNAQT